LSQGLPLGPSFVGGGYFQDDQYFEWIEYVLRTAAMFILAFILEFVRNLTGRKGDTKPE
jgi:hypothetical protein